MEDFNFNPTEGLNNTTVFESKPVSGARAREQFMILLNQMKDYLKGVGKTLTDFEYQTPTIDGTEIQLTKRSDSKRLFFLLEEDLSGGAITIKTGETSKPLRYPNGTFVTEIPMGFVEVVENAENFTYAPKGGAGIDYYFGGGVDGELDTTDNVTLTSTLDGEPIIKKYSSVKINSGHTLTVSNPCQGLIIYSEGDVIINGHIDMSKKAGISDYAYQPIIPVDKDGEMLFSKYLELTNVLLNLKGGAGGNGGYGGGKLNGTNRSTGGTGSPGRINLGGFGGGGGGGLGGDANKGNDGANGGRGGGACQYTGSFYYDGNGYAGYVISENGAGGMGGRNSYTSPCDIAPGGTGYAKGGGSGGSGGVYYYNGTGGTSLASLDAEYAGGFVLIIAKGNVTVTGSIKANGGNGSNGTNGGSSYSYGTGGGGGGGGAGGGVIAIFHKGTFTNSGAIQVNGGLGGSGGSPAGSSNEAGGSGTSGSAGTIYTQEL